MRRHSEDEWRAAGFAPSSPTAGTPSPPRAIASSAADVAPLLAGGGAGDPSKSMKSMQSMKRVPGGAPSTPLTDGERHLHPAAHADGNGSLSVRECAMNLSNAIMGAGALALPNLFKVVGVVPGLALLLFAWLWTWFSMAIMIQAADAVSKRVLRGEPVGSYEDLMAHTLGPRGRTASTVGIVSLQIGCLVGFANVLADVVSPFADEMLPPGLEPNRSAILAAVALGGMLPTGLLVGGESHALLATVSKAALGVVATFAAVLVAHAFSPRRVESIDPGGFTDQAAAAIAVDGADAIAWFAPLTGLTSVLPLAIFAFGAHPAVLPVVRAVRCEGGPGSQVRSISHWSPYDRVGVVNAVP